jgi:hypothetical protein
MPHVRSLTFVLPLVLLGACSRAPEAPPPDAAAAAQAARETAAAKQLALYEQMRTGGSVELAASLGEEILARYPGTAAAAQVQRSIDELRAKAAAQTEARRLARLWTYAAAAMSGGTQYTAAIDSKSPPAPSARARLVLREHPQWGSSVYLLLDHARFDCAKGCATLAVAFDDAPAERMKAVVPPTGEPALFIDDDRGFRARLIKARTVTIAAPIAGRGVQSLVFEVAGFDAGKLPHR